MKLTMKISDTTSCEVDGDTQSEVFEQLAAVQEIFANGVCGKCGNKDVRYVVRTIDDNKYYEMRCNDTKCRAKLSFGQNKKGGGLFPKRKDGDKWLDHGGWTVYVPPKNT